MENNLVFLKKLLMGGSAGNDIKWKNLKSLKFPPNKTTGFLLK
jgi:hypothetical protein